MRQHESLRFRREQGAGRCDDIAGIDVIEKLAQDAVRIPGLKDKKQ
jgi:hypothetical protein